MTSAFHAEEVSPAETAAEEAIRQAEEEDEHVQRLQESGALQQVVGSQSMLSQELPSEYLEDEDIIEVTPSHNPMASAAKSYGLLTPAEQQGASESSPSLNDENEEEEMQFSQETLKLSTAANLGSLLDAMNRVQDKEPSIVKEEAEPPLEKQTQKKKKRTRRQHPLFRQVAAALPKRTKKVSPDEELLVPKKPKLPPRTVASTRPKRTKRAKPAGDDYYYDGEEGEEEEEDEKEEKKVVAAPRPPPKKKSRNPSTKDSTPDQKVAARAAILAARTSQDEKLCKQLLLQMVLRRSNPRAPPPSVPGPGHVLPDRFVWAHYPPLEQVLKENMRTYYEYSIFQCQSLEQQEFNNEMVNKVQRVADEWGWSFDPERYKPDGKMLRDRIRCYYKTHVQNAKKRLTTMLRNPTKRSNAIHLMEEYDLIAQTATQPIVKPPRRIKKQTYNSSWLTKKL